MSDRAEAKRRRRKKRLKKRRAAQRNRAPLQIIRCCGGKPITPEDALAAAAGDTEGAAFWNYIAHKDKVTIEGTRVVNRAPVAVAFGLTVEEPPADPGDPKSPVRVRTLDDVKIEANGFIDFQTYRMKPLFVMSFLADDADVMDRLQDNCCVPKRPQCDGPWIDAEVPGVSFSPTHLHCANKVGAYFVAVCRGENEGGNARCGFIRMKVNGRYLISIRSAARRKSCLEMLLSDAEKAAEAAELREYYAAEVAAGKVSAAEAEKMLSLDPGSDEWLDPDWIELVAVLPRGASRRSIREAYDKANAKAVPR